MWLTLRDQIMSSLVPFSFDSHQVRVVTDNGGAPWFVAKDIAAALGYSNTKQAVLDHCRKAKSLNDLGVVNRDPDANQALTVDQQTKLIPESDVYRLTMRSKLDSAERFQDWVVEEVLPSIRKTGGYQAPSHRQSEVDIAALKLSPIAARAAKAFGFKGNMATLSADNAVRRITGSSPLALFGQSALKAEDQDALLIVTEIANRLGIKAREVNPLLTKSGLQTEYRDAKGKLCYEMTETGKAFGVFVDTGKNHGDGAPVRQLKWRASVVTFLVGQVRIDPA